GGGLKESRYVERRQRGLCRRKLCCQVRERVAPPVAAVDVDRSRIRKAERCADMPDIPALASLEVERVHADVDFIALAQQPRQEAATSCRSKRQRKCQQRPAPGDQIWRRTVQRLLPPARRDEIVAVGIHLPRERSRREGIRHVATSTGAERAARSVPCG